MTRRINSRGLRAEKTRELLRPSVLASLFSAFRQIRSLKKMAGIWSRDSSLSLYVRLIPEPSVLYQRSRKPGSAGRAWLLRFLLLLSSLNFVCSLSTSIPSRLLNFSTKVSLYLSILASPGRLVPSRRYGWRRKRRRRKAKRSTLFKICWRVCPAASV